MADITNYKTVDGKLYTIPPIKDLCTILETKFKTQEDIIEYWKTKYSNAISGNKEYQKLKKENEELENQLCNGFGILKEEKDAIDSWLAKHKKTHLNGYISYKFTPTSIGTSGEIICSCGENFEFREIS